MNGQPQISVMLAVPDAPAAADWYSRALGAVEVAGTRTVRVEVFVDDPDTFVRRALEAGADGRNDPVRDHAMPWGPHRQGSFLDPFGHLWLVGDKSPLQPH